IGGQPFQREIVPPKFEPVPAASPVRDLAAARIALVTDGGLVAEGNPEHMDPSGARKFTVLPISGLAALSPDAFDVSRAGCDTTLMSRDPHRLVPLDIMRELEAEGRIGSLHEYVYATAGIGSDVESAARTGKGIAERLREAGVDGVILTST